MQIACPNCGAKVTADRINIHKMTAVCASCDTVFPFEPPEAKAKRRKVKQPVKLTLRDADSLHMEFWTNFRLERNETALVAAFLGVALAVPAFLMIEDGDAPLILPLVFLLASFACFYALALTVVNKTHIVMDEDAITVTRKPLPSPLNQAYVVPLAGVSAIKYEETAISKKEAYDTPRYRVWAETPDGISRTIVNNVTEEYAVFIAQRLEERLHMDALPDVSRLEDGGHPFDDNTELHEIARVSQHNMKQ